MNKGVPSYGQGSVSQIKAQNVLCSGRVPLQKRQGQGGYLERAPGDLWDSEKSMTPTEISQTSSNSQKTAGAIDSLLAIKIRITIIDQEHVALRPRLCWEDKVLSSMFPSFTETTNFTK